MSISIETIQKVKTGISSTLRTFRIELNRRCHHALIKRLRATSASPPSRRLNVVHGVHFGSYKVGRGRTPFVLNRFKTNHVAAVLFQPPITKTSNVQKGKGQGEWCILVSHLQNSPVEAEVSWRRPGWKQVDRFRLYMDHIRVHVECFDDCLKLGHETQKGIQRRRFEDHLGL
jgi:hypothetical protein